MSNLKEGKANNVIQQEASSTQRLIDRRWGKQEDNWQSLVPSWGLEQEYAEEACQGTREEDRSSSQRRYSSAGKVEGERGWQEA
jgi:hypothetical protein